MKILLETSKSGSVDSNSQKIVDGAKELGMEVCTFYNIPFTNKYEGFSFLLHNKEPLFIYTSTKFMELFDLSHEGLIFKFNGISQTDQTQIFDKIKKGIYYNQEKFSQDWILKNTELKEYLLNGDCQIMSLDKALDQTFNNVFIKPASDLKYFSGGVLENGTLRNFLAHQTHSDDIFVKNPEIIISSTQNIKNEYRFFYINGEISTGSQYKKENYSYTKSPIPTKVWEFAQKISKLYQPAQCFALDIATVDNKGQLNYKIVEYNCLNCAGLYQVNVFKYLKDLEALLVHNNYFGYKNKI